MGVGGNGGLVAGGGLEVNESGVLHEQISVSPALYGGRDAYLAAAEVKVLDLAKLGESSPQRALLDLAVDILDVCALLVGLSSGRLVLCAGLLLLVASD